MEVKVFLICTIGLISSLSMTSCSAITTDYNDSANILGQVMANGYSAELAQYFETFLQADVENAYNGPNLLSGTTGDFQLAFFGNFRDPKNTCVTVTNTNSGSNIDELFTYNCTGNAGTVEAKSASGTTAQNFEVITNANLVGIDYPSNTETIDSDYTVSVVTGVMTVTKHFDDTFATTNYNYEAKGNSSDVVTPTDITQPLNGGTIQVSSTFQYLINGTSYGTVAATSSGLGYSSCGLNTGSITFADGATTLILTFNGCGTPTLTNNGSAVTWP